MKKVIICLIVLCSIRVFGQDKGFHSEGREFFIGHIFAPTGVIPLYYQYPYKIRLFISTFEENRITINYFNNSGQAVDVTDMNIQPMGMTEIVLDRTKLHPSHFDKEVPEYKSVMLSAKRPVSVTYMSMGPASGGSYKALPTSAWGRRYVVASYNDNPKYGARWPDSVSNFAGVFVIIAAYNGTNVTITPAANTIGGGIGVFQGPGSDGTPKPYMVTLNRGQSYYVRSASVQTDGTDDISSTLIESDKPIAVIAGHENAHVGDGSSGDKAMDENDLIIEQLVPADFWDNKDIIGVPQRETQGSITEGIGENYRVYCADKNIPTLVTAYSFSLGTSVNLVPKVFSPAPEIENSTSPISFSSQSPTDKFLVVQYDLRAQGNQRPFPAPSMSILVPKSQWRTSYLHFTKEYLNQNYESNYITVIAPSHQFDQIKVARSGSQMQPIGNVLTPFRSWSEGYKAVIYSITQSSYQFKASFPFMVYAHGHYMLDNDGSVNDGNAFVETYAHPVGMTLFDKLVENTLSISVDTLCTGWKICATDNNTNGGIRFVNLIDDAGGNFFPDKSYAFMNCTINAADDPRGLNEITYIGDDTFKCFTINITDPSQETYAPVAVYDRSGNMKLVELRMRPGALTFSENTKDPKRAFAPIRTGKDICTKFALRNGTSNTRSYTVTSAATATSYFTVTGTTPSLPVSLKPGDSLVVDICFKSDDALIHRDNILFESDCDALQIPLEASAVYPTFTANDAVFGTLKKGEKLCKDITLKNTSTVPIEIQGYTLNSSRFTVDETTLPSFPWTLAPNTTVTVKVCYENDGAITDTAVITWQTDVTPPYGSGYKSTSLLSGKGQDQTSVSNTADPSFRVSVLRNPVVDYLPLVVSQQSPRDITLLLTDILGNVVYRRVIRPTVPITETTLYIRNLTSGIYTLVVLSENGTAVEKIIKNK